MSVGGAASPALRHAFPTTPQVVEVTATWIDNDHETGQKWIEKDASPLDCAVEMTGKHGCSSYSVKK